MIIRIEIIEKANDSRSHQYIEQVIQPYQPGTRPDLSMALHLRNYRLRRPSGYICHNDASQSNRNDPHLKRESAKQLSLRDIFVGYKAARNRCSKSLAT